MKDAVSVSNNNQEELNRELDNAQILLERLRQDHSAQEKNLREAKCVALSISLIYVVVSNDNVNVTYLAN
jgi:hypothetical protein